MREGGLITVGGGGIGYPNTYDTREKEMGERLLGSGGRFFAGLEAPEPQEHRG